MGLDQYAQKPQKREAFHLSTSPVECYMRNSVGNRKMNRKDETFNKVNSR